MKKSLLAVLIATPLMLGLSGCVVSIGGDDDSGFSSFDYEDREYENRQKIARLQLNTSFSAIQTELGVADFNETYAKEGENIQVLYYRTHRKHKDGMTTKDECTPLIFKDGKLVSWGEQAYRQL